MPRPILPSSPQALEPIDSRYKAKYTFPFDELIKGFSFPVEFNEVSSLAVLRTTADRYGKKLGKKFRVIKHATEYEVCCIATGLNDVIDTSSKPVIDPSLSIQEAAKQFYAPGYDPSKPLSAQNVPDAGIDD